MALDTVRQHPGVAPDLHDDFAEMKQQILRRYRSPWTRMNQSGSASFTHGLGGIPWFVDVLKATDAQGTGEAVAGNVTISKTASTVTLTDLGGGGAYFIRIRAVR